ncbi:hypothetical protein L1049_015908 [Liquidambar formosana]|uniref:Uncharacterized protein n=1 Tax=Liquidambar formosana TaxID=63359 RepID=A0AAP0RYU6_LIQFO
MAEECVYVMKRDRDGRISWHAFDPAYQLWQSLPPVPVEYSEALGFGYAILSGCHLYLFGGKDPLRGSMIRFIVDFKRKKTWRDHSTIDQIAMAITILTAFLASAVGLHSSYQELVDEVTDQMEAA